MKKKLYLIIICVIIMASCHPRLNNALKLAGSNRSELEKVLEHFKNDSNQLKYKSAVFLIENMPYHSTLYPVKTNTYNNIYANMAGSPKEQRDSVLKAKIAKAGEFTANSLLDITTVKADFLIKAINDACDTWCQAKWSEDYDEKIFFEYVLPYRVANEPLSDWRGFAKHEFPYLKQPIIYSNMGVKYQASDAVLNHVRTAEEPSSSNGRCVCFENQKSLVEFTLMSAVPLQKLINFRYNSVSKGTKVIVELNGVKMKEIGLEPTNNLHTFRSSRFGIPVQLHKGNNTLTVRYVNGRFALDYIEMAAWEPLDETALPDFSGSYCQICNVASGMYASIDTLQANMLKPIELHKYTPKNLTLNLRLDYLGYSSWKISAMDSINMCMEDRWVSFDIMAPVGKYNYLGANHQKWVIIPIKDDMFKIMNKETGLFWDELKDPETGKLIIVQNAGNGKVSQLWRITKKGINPFYESFFKIGSAISKALKVTDVMEQFEFIGNRGDYSPSLKNILKYKTGTCQDECSYTLALSRYMGIPTAVDFTPHWGNRTNSHAWSVIILPNGKGTPLYMGCAPGDTAQYFHSYLKPKVYRHSFQINRKIVEDMQDEASIPELFVFPDFVDVTNEYYKTVDVKREIPFEYHDRKIAYICVFDREKWIPVDYGKVSMGSVKFKSMGRNILYSVCFYEYGETFPVGNPFIITSEGKVNEVAADYTKKMSMTLLRKYPFFGKQDFYNIRMNLGKFQGDNTIEFENPTTFYLHEGITEGCWYEKILKKKTCTYTFLRYLSGPNSYCNINELEFYDNNYHKITGKIIGTKGTENQCKETVFDGDVLTGFNGNSPDGHWVGLELTKPSTVLKIRYMPRNDGNCIEVGDIYELLMYNQGKWRIMRLKRARKAKLIFNNMPTGGLYILKDKTKGAEERIFTYNKGKQVWW